MRTRGRTETIHSPETAARYRRENRSVPRCFACGSKSPEGTGKKIMRKIIRKIMLMASKEGIDEMAEQNLKRCDAICLKIFVGVMVAVAFGAAIFGHINAVSTGTIGWAIVLSILVLSIIRTVMFAVMDSKGV